MDGIRIEEAREPRPEDVQFLGARLIEFNREFAGDFIVEPIGIFARDRQGSIVGGLSGSIARDWLHVDLLWVESALRGGGLGSDLLVRAENRARERDCVGIYLETYDFQALPFYERRGYEAFGVLEGRPRGSRQHYLAKRIE